MILKPEALPQKGTLNEGCRDLLDPPKGTGEQAQVASSADSFPAPLSTRAGFQQDLKQVKDSDNCL